ncbi:MAG: low molecular weight protein arginine phosphatase [Gemmatimonadetes bacterium]|nr:low molecular weight protein arginine phosphatase [Gemmatimonadota bacterium]
MHLLFVCTGNTCRSPLAEALARAQITMRGVQGVTVSSAGTSAWGGASASDGSLLVGMEHGLDLSGHRARVLTRELVAASDLILAMGPHHVEAAESLGGEGKSFLLTEYATRGASRVPVSDPFGGDLEVYRVTLAELERQVGLALDRALAERGSPS